MDQYPPGALESELQVLRRQCAEYQRHLEEQQEALVALSLKRNEEFIMLYSLLEFSKTIAASSDRNGLLDAALRLLGDIFGLHSVAIFELPRGQQQFVLIATSIEMPEVAGPISVPPVNPIVHPVLQSAQVCLVDLAGVADSFAHQFVPAMTAALSAPMLSRGELCGVIAAFGTADCFNDRHFQIMSAVGTYLSLGIERSDWHSRMEQQALTDGLTGLLNRRALDERLREEIDRASRYQDPLCLLMVDVDHFKEFNDRYGHDMGDLVLKDVARLLRLAVRSGDTCARYGGEEFVTILPRTELSLAWIVAERIRQAVEAMCGERLETKGGRLERAVTVSIGVAKLDDYADDAAVLLYRADRSLYLAKAQGRNRVHCFELNETTASH